MADFCHLDNQKYSFSFSLLSKILKFILFYLFFNKIFYLKFWYLKLGTHIAYIKVSLSVFATFGEKGTNKEQLRDMKNTK